MTGHRAMQPLIDAQEKLRRAGWQAQAGDRAAAVDEALKKKLVKRLGKELEAAIFSPDKDKAGREDATRDLRQTVTAEFAERAPIQRRWASSSSRSRRTWCGPRS